MEKGRRIYTDKATGNFILDTGECGDVVSIPTTEDEFLSYPALMDRNPDTVEVTELEYEQNKQDFREGVFRGIDPTTKQLLFSYPDPQAPGEITTPQPALSVQVKELASILEKQSLNADDVYKKTNIYQTTLDELKKYKITQLDYLCNKTILEGYKSSALGSLHRYSLDVDGQLNLSGIMNAINAGLISESIAWKTDVGNLQHTIDQMKQVYIDGLVFKQTQIEKYWHLKNQVQSATTKEEVNSIDWN